MKRMMLNPGIGLEEVKSVAETKQTMCFVSQNEQLYCYNSFPTQSRGVLAYAIYTPARLHLKHSYFFLMPEMFADGRQRVFVCKLTSRRSAGASKAENTAVAIPTASMHRSRGTQQLQASELRGRDRERERRKRRGWEKIIVTSRAGQSRFLSHNTPAGENVELQRSKALPSK